MTVGERVRLLRKKYLHLTQEGLGEPLGLTRANIANIEAGRISVTDRVIIALCDKFSVNEEWLRNGTGEMFVNLSREEEIAEFIGCVLAEKDDSFKKRYIDMLSKLDDDGWAALERVAEAIKKKKKD